VLDLGRDGRFHCGDSTPPQRSKKPER
jgi:hypothetical protein